MDLIERPELTQNERQALETGAACEGFFDFMGNPVRIAGNHPGPLESFRTMYAAFARGQPGGPEALEIFYRLHEDRGDNVLTLLSDGEVFRVRHADVVRWGFGILTYLLLLRIRTHYLVHAGCIARDGQGIVISGDSRMGKTTLVSHLVSRGHGFLSDEIAPIARHEPFVEPFPRRLSIRPGPADTLIADDADSLAFRTEFDERTLVDVAHLRGAQRSERVPLHAVLFLTSEVEGRVTTPMKFDGRIRVGFTSVPDGLEEALTGLPGVELVERTKADGLPGYLLSIEHPEAFLPQVQALTEKFETGLTEWRYDNLEPPDHGAEPRLVPIPAAAGVVELVKKMPGAFKRQMLEQVFDGKLTNLFAELSGVVKDVAFYRFAPGRLEAMIDLVERLP